MADDDSERRVLSRKELARELRRAAYQREKQRRAQDPRHLAMKEAAKEQRRQAYQAAKARRANAPETSKLEEAAKKRRQEAARLAKERRQATRAEQKSKQKEQLAQERAAKRRSADQALWELVGGRAAERRVAPVDTAASAGSDERGASSDRGHARKAMKEIEFADDAVLGLWMTKGSDAQN